MQSTIKIQNARVNNLKNISLEIPRDKLIVITGLSGSGKSSLAFDTIFAEGQRRYIESLSSYARQFLGQMDKPDVEKIEGLSPAISIDQKTTSKNPRSTVGTVTEIYDYLRLLFARVGHAHCPKCGKPIESQSIDQMISRLEKLPTGTKIFVLAQIVRDKKGSHVQTLEKIRRDGFVRVRIDGELRDLDEEISLNKKTRHTIEVVIDRLILRPESRTRIADSIETALKIAGGIAHIFLPDSNEEILFSENFACIDCGISLPEITPRLFSFNSPYGACPNCTGLGRKMDLDPSQFKNYFDYMYAMYDFRVNEKASKICPVCHGARLKPEALAVKIDGKNIFEVTSLSIRDVDEFFKSIQFSAREKKISAQILREIRSRLKFLRDVGLDYLTLARSSGTLSGGEAQRIRLATQIGSGLVGVLYILDEPSIGLHQRDNARLIETLKRLRDLGNTLIVVEHDEDTIRAADQIIDIGIGAGENGGSVVAQGSVEDISKVAESITGQFLSGRRSIPVPKIRRAGNGKFLEVIGAQENNLKNIDVKFPLGKLILVTGVSGSGKSTLVNDILYNGLAKKLYHAKENPGNHRDILGIDLIDKVINIDQQPISRTPRSNPATYTGAFNFIRELFAQTPAAKMRGYNVGRFSFNVKGGRCETCAGDGILRIEMHFLPDVYVPCEVCHGARYNRETLEVKYKGKSISDVLEMTVDEAVDFFSNVPKIYRQLKIIQDVGLGYIKLGQSATTLSGGEAQRVKLATELAKKPTGKTIYILDEPTTGLHSADIEKLLGILQRLVDGGDTVIVIEHNLDVIKCADHIIDLGLEGGDAGGSVIATGTPEEIAKVKESYTGQFLKKVLRK
ncbi:MAG: excinuclease ABC subunit UvrA [Selenomonadaceae bacterium]|nr:excinuclease ABC subunit UvrA [Selenomonadaceae bacterium]